MLGGSGGVAISPTGGISFPPDPLDQGVTAALDPTEGVYCWVVSARFALMGRQGLVCEGWVQKGYDKDPAASSQQPTANSHPPTAQTGSSDSRLPSWLRLGLVRLTPGVALGYGDGCRCGCSVRLLIC